MANLNDPLGAHSSIPTFSRSVTPAQESLLDCMSHLDGDGPALLKALTWMHTMAQNSVSGGATEEVIGNLDRVKNLMAWLGDLVEEKRAYNP